MEMICDYHKLTTLNCDWTVVELMILFPFDLGKMASNFTYFTCFVNTFLLFSLHVSSKSKNAFFSISQINSCINSRSMCGDNWIIQSRVQ